MTGYETGNECGHPLIGSHIGGSSSLEDSGINQLHTNPNILILIKGTDAAELRTVHAWTDVSVLRLQGAPLHPLLLPAQPLAVLSAPDLPHVLHDGGVAAHRLATLLAGHLPADPDFLHMWKKSNDLPLK